MLETRIEEVPWTSIQKVIVQTNLQKLKNSIGYLQGKYLGNGVAAYEMARLLIKENKLEEIQKSINPDIKTFIIPVQQHESYGYNAIPVGYAYALAKRLNLEVIDSVYKTKGQPNTNRSLISRGANQIGFEGSLPKGYARYIIVDDNITTGRTLKALFEFIYASGNSTACISTLAFSRYGVRFIPDQEQMANLKLIPFHKHKIESLYGKEIKELTGGEVQAFIFRNSKYFKDGKSFPRDSQRYY